MRKQTTETSNTLSAVVAWFGDGAKAQVRGTDRGVLLVLGT